MLRVYVDAATKNQVGISAGAVILSNGVKQQQFHLFLGDCSNHEAEFKIFIHALNLLIEKQHNQQTIIIHSDSQVVVKTFEKKYTKNALFKPYLETFLQLSPLFSLLLIKWIPEKKNKGADTLAKQTLIQYDKMKKHL